MGKPSTGAWLVSVAIVVLSPRFEGVADAANCGPGTVLTDRTESYQCATDEFGSPIMGVRKSCYIQACNEDSIPDNQGPCWSYVWCPGQPSRAGACAEAINAGPQVCPFTIPLTSSCHQICDEVCGNGIDDNEDGRIDEGCNCDGNEAGCCEGQMGHPVGLESGGVTTDPVEDFSLPTPSIPVTVERTWISTSPVDVVSPAAGFGKRWHSNLEERLTPGGTSMIWYRPDGRTVAIPLQSGTSLDGFSIRLVADPDGYRLISTDGVTTSFDLAGRLRKRLQNGHGLAGVTYSDEGTFVDCPSGDGKLRICRLFDSRGTEIRLAWSADLVIAITLAPDTSDAWTVQYQYDATKLLLSVSSPLRTVAYGYSDQIEINRNLVSVSAVPGTGQPPLVLEHHDWYDKKFPGSIRGRARVSIGRNSAIGFRWGYCDLGQSNPYCEINAQMTADDQRNVSTYDLRMTDRDAGTACTSDQGCPANFTCVFIGTTSPGGRCKPMANADVVTLKKGRVVNRTVGCATCNGEPTVVWDDSTGVKKSTKSDSGRNTTYQYDASGRVTRMIENDTDMNAATVPSDATYRMTNITYDGVTGRVGGVVQTSNLVPGATRTQTFSYNASGQVASVAIAGYTRPETDPSTPAVSTRTTSFAYQDGLLTQIDGPRADVPDVLSIEYYPSNASGVNDRYRLHRMCRATGNTARPTLCTEFANYDLWGNARQLTDPDAVVSTLTYDSSGRVLSLVRNAAIPSASIEITYDGAGNVSTFKEESGRCRQYTFGDFGALTRVTWRATCDALSEVLRDDVFVAAQVGRIVSSRTTVAGNVVDDVQFTYDARGRFEKLIKPLLAGSPYQILTRTPLGFVSKSENEDCLSAPVREGPSSTGVTSTRAPGR
jgi:YD repeat-containing protein